MGLIATEASAIRAALTFMTRLPLGGDPSDEAIAASVKWYPLAGAVIGGCLAAVFWFGGYLFRAEVSIVLAMVVGLALTGALHEDGLADTFDGLGAGPDRDRMLAAMKDSGIGAFGVIAVVSVLLLKFVTLAATADLLVIWVLIAAHVLSRVGVFSTLRTAPYARSNGKAGFASGASGWFVVTATGALAVIPLWMAAGWASVLAGAFALAIAQAALRWRVEGRLGGYTGDTLGATQQVGETAFYLGVLAVA